MPVSLEYSFATANRLSPFTVMSSNSGVRNIRAMFEAKSEYTSPPSRGRSPVGSDGTATRSTSSRPLSKVRTSFVAVERSGQLGPQLGLRRMSNNGEAASSVDPGSEAAANKTSGMDHSEAPKVNGSVDNNANMGVDSAPASSTLQKVKEEEISNESKEPLLDDKGNTALSQENHTINTDENDALNGDIPSSNVEDLGSVLKGSPFNPEESAENPIPQETKASNAGAKTTTTPSKKETAEKGTPAEPKSISPTKPKSFTSRPLAIRTKKDIGGSPQVKTPGEVSKSSNSPRTPKTPATKSNQPPNIPSPRQPLSKTSSPKNPTSMNGGKRLSETSKEPTRKTSRTSIASTVSIPSKQQPSTSTAASRKPASAPAHSTSAKPKAKSPTRPARLRAAATAPTAASAAKLGGLPPSRSPSRIGSTAISRKPSTLNKDASSSRLRGPQTGTTATKALRPPPASNPTAERPKSRNTVGKAPDEGFLARMMKPTASSASKVHDKLDQKSPPRKGVSGKPKRKSEGVDEGKSKHAEPATIAKTLVEDHSSANGANEKNPTEEIPAAVHDGKEFGSSTEPVAT